MVLVDIVRYVLVIGKKMRPKKKIFYLFFLKRKRVDKKIYIKEKRDFF
jgi:hypothetical protein